MSEIRCECHPNLDGNQCPNTATVTGFLWGVSGANGSDEVSLCDACASADDEFIWGTRPIDSDPSSEITVKDWVNQ